MSRCRAHLFGFVCVVCAFSAYSLLPEAESAGKPFDSENGKADSYGDPLPDGASVRIGTVRFRHSDTVTCLAFSPDGKCLASGSDDGTLRLWDVETGKELGDFGDKVGRLSCVAFSPDGKTLVCGNEYLKKRTVTIFDLESCKELRRIPQEDKGIYALAVNMDGKTLAVKATGTVQVWDLKTGQKLNRHDQDLDSWPTLAFSADGSVLAVGGKAGAVDLWDRDAGHYLRSVGGVAAAATPLPGESWDGAESRRRQEAEANTAMTLAFSADGQTLNVVHRAGLIGYDVASGKVVARHDLKMEYEHQYNAALSPRGDLIAYGDYARIDLQHLGAGKDSREWSAHRSWVKCLAFSPDGKRLASGGVDHAIRVWDVSTQKPLHAFASEPGGSVSVQLVGPERLALHHYFSNSMGYPGGGVTISSTDPVTQLADRRTGRAVPQPVLKTLGDDLPYFVPGGDVILVPGIEGLMRVLDANTGEELRCVGERGDSYRKYPVAVTADGRMLLMASNDGAIHRQSEYRQRLWDLTTGDLIAELDPANGGSWAVSPRSDLLAVANRCGGDNEHTVQLLEAKTGKWLPIVATTLIRGSFTDFSPDGNLLAVGGQVDTIGPHLTTDALLSGEDGPDHSCIKLWEISTWSKVAEFPKHPGEVRCCFSPNGLLLATGCKDGTIRLLDVLAEKEVRLLRGHRGEINSLAFTPDGKALVSGSDDGTALVWDVTPYGPATLGAASEKELETLWIDLGGANGVKAYRASARLTRAGPPAVAFLGKRVRPLLAPAAQAFDHMLADLDSNDFTVRDRAMKSLTGLERSAIPALKQAQEGKLSLEVGKRVEQLLTDADSPTASPERVRDLRALAILEQIGTAEARDTIKKVAGGAPEARLTHEAKAALFRLSERTALAPRWAGNSNEK